MGLRAGVALGANLGDRLAGLTKARAEIFALRGIQPPLLASSLFETEPVDCEPDAQKFINAVIEFGYDGESSDLLGELQRIEVALGRPLLHPINRSRTIDLDLLYHDGAQVDGTQLTLPHPRMRFREFVLRPLAEIRPELILPGETRTIAQLADELPPTPAVVRLTLQW